MAMLCRGKKSNGFPCGGSLYRCKKCGAVGCSTSSCGNQNFNSQVCMKCGKQERQQM